jgi:hypothetical protein
MLLVIDAKLHTFLVVHVGRIWWCLDFVGEFGGDFSECLFFGDLSDRTGKMVTDMVAYVKWSLRF